MVIARPGDTVLLAWDMDMRMDADSMLLIKQQLEELCGGYVTLVPCVGLLENVIVRGDET